MGLKEILTKPLNFGGSYRLSWKEPYLYRIQLRNDLWKRVLIVAAAWAGASGVLLMLFSVNVKPPGFGTALGLGVAAGLGPAFLILFMRQALVSGRVRVFDETLEREFVSAGLGRIQRNYFVWPWESLRRCTLVPAEAIEQSFSVLIIEADEGSELIAIPASIDRRQAGTLLKESGVQLSTAKQIPEEWSRGLSLPITVGISIVGFAILLAGAVMFGRS